MIGKGEASCVKHVLQGPDLEFQGIQLMALLSVETAVKSVITSFKKKKKKNIANLSLLC